MGVNETVSDGSSPVIRLDDLAYGSVEHSGGHYGQLVEELRDQWLGADGIAATEVGLCLNLPFNRC
jgi:hypothetical protein